MVSARDVDHAEVPHGVLAGMCSRRLRGMKFTAGRNIAMKVPPHQHDAMVAFYRDVVGLKPVEDRPPHIGFEFGSNTLWIDSVPGMSQAEIWLELFTDDFDGAAKHLADANVVRCDAIETLPEGFQGGWITTPASIIHLVRKPDAW